MRTSRRAALAAIAACAFVAACTKPAPELPFAGTWNNSTSGKEGMWLFITRSDDQGDYLVRVGVGQPGNIGFTGSAKLNGATLDVPSVDVIKGLMFLDETHNTLVTVNNGIPEIKFYRQP